MIGLSYHWELDAWFSTRPSSLSFVEVPAERRFRAAAPRLRWLRSLFPLTIRCRSLSLNTPGALDPDDLALVTEVVRDADPQWISQVVGMNRGGSIGFGLPVPGPLTGETLAAATAHASELASRLDRPVLLENTFAVLRVNGDLNETQFLEALCRQTGCALVADVGALSAASREKRLDPLAWTRSLAQHVAGMRISGCSRRDGRWRASDNTPIDRDIWDLAAEMVSVVPPQHLVVAGPRHGWDLRSAECDLERAHALLLP